ncbi:MAG: DNA topology modulation protein FlaR [Sporolactobacillus sp.]
MSWLVRFGYFVEEERDGKPKGWAQEELVKIVRISRQAFLSGRKCGDKLKQTIPDRIHIIRSVGSGKTTLACKISEKYDIPYYELDNIVWRRTKSGDIERTTNERDAYLERIVSTKKWIIKGAQYHKWVLKSFINADLVIFLDTPYLVRLYRITKRFIRQLLGIEAANYTPSFKIFMKMFEWNSHFEKISKPKILKMCQQDSMHSIILKNVIELNSYFD